MKKLLLTIFYFLRLLSVFATESPYHGYIKELEIMNYDKMELTVKLYEYLEERKNNIEATLMNFDLCLRTKRHDHYFNLAKNYILDGALCSNSRTSAHGYIHEGVFFGRIQEPNSIGGYIKHVFSDMSHIKDKKEHSKGHSVFYRNDQIDYELVEKNIKRHHHPYKPIEHFVVDDDEVDDKVDDNVDDKDDVENDNDYHIKISKSKLNQNAKEDAKNYNNTLFGQSILRRSKGTQTKTDEKKKDDKKPFKNICTTHIDFHPTYLGEDRKLISVLLETLTMFESLNKVYAQNFHENGNPLIQYVIVSYRLLKGDDLKSMNSHLPAVTPVLNHYNDDARFKSTRCASVFLAHTNWVLTLGMARIGNNKTSIGICGEQANSVITSYQMGTRVNVLIIENTIIHEFGHNLGASHDPTAECSGNECANETMLELCSPGGQNGMYIMYYSSNSGSFPNNNQFSPCSKAAILPLLKMPSRRTCFIASNDPICGNGVVEKGEQCDSIEDNDQCCRMKESGANKACTLYSGKACSPSMGSCCTDQCTFVDANTSCVKATDCAGGSVCSGNNATCPVPVFKPLRTVCDRNTKSCDGKGLCNLSLCEADGKKECECPGDDKDCVVCCKDNEKGACAPLNFKGKPSTYKLKGDMCKSGKGLCSEKNECLLMMDNAGFTKFWSKLISGNLTSEALTFVTDHLWMNAAAVGGALIIVMIVSCIFKRDTSIYLKNKYDLEQRKLEGKFNMNSQKSKNKQDGTKNDSNHPNFDMNGSGNFYNNYPQNMNQMGYNPNFTPNPMQNNMPMQNMPMQNMPMQNNMGNPYGSQQQFMGTMNSNQPFMGTMSSGQQFMGTMNPQYGSNSMYFQGNMPQQGNFYPQNNYGNSAQQMNMDPKRGN